MTNKEIVQRVYDLIFNGHNPEAAKDFIKENYIQHNPRVETGREGFIKFFRQYFKDFPKFRAEIKRVISEGDYVVVHLNGIRTPGERGVAVVDIYRLETGKLAEHWDVIQPVPEEKEMAHRNTMF